MATQASTSHVDGPTGAHLSREDIEHRHNRQSQIELLRMDYEHLLKHAGKSTVGSQTYCNALAVAAHGLGVYAMDKVVEDICEDLSTPLE